MIIPPWTIEFYSLIKSTELLSFIGILDLLGTVRSILIINMKILSV